MIIELPFDNCSAVYVGQWKKTPAHQKKFKQSVQGSLLAYYRFDERYANCTNSGYITKQILETVMLQWPTDAPQFSYQPESTVNVDELSVVDVYLVDTGKAQINHLTGSAASLSPYFNVTDNDPFVASRDFVRASAVAGYAKYQHGAITGAAGFMHDCAVGWL